METELVEAAVAISRNHPVLLTFWRDFAVFSSPSVLMILGLTVVLWSAWRSGWSGGVVAALSALLLGRAVAPLLKVMVQRPRPTVLDPVAIEQGYSFPSGHATYAAVVAATLVLLFWPHCSWRARMLTLAAAVLLVVLTALDRVFLGVHYPSDVLAGIVIGLAFALVVWRKITPTWR